MYVFCITYYELLLCAYKNIYTSLLITAENRRPTAVTKTPPLHHPQLFTAHGSQHLYGIPGGFFQQFPVADGRVNHPPHFFFYGVRIQANVAAIFLIANPCGEYDSPFLGR